MPEKALISSLASGLSAALLAGILQISVVLVLALRMRPLQYIGSFFVSTIIGGGLTVVLQEQYHWSPFLAGVLGAFSGALPAVLMPLILMRLTLKRLGMTDGDLTHLFDTVRGMNAQTNPQEDDKNGPAQP